MESDNERQSRVGDEPIAKCCFWIVLTTAVVTLVMLIAILLVGYPLQLPLR